MNAPRSARSPDGEIPRRLFSSFRKSHTLTDTGTNRSLHKSYLFKLFSHNLLLLSRYPWVDVVVIASVVGVIEYIPAAFLATALPYKLRVIDDIMLKHGLTAFIFSNMGIALACVLFSCALTIFVAPSAAGSGIPAIIAYLSNGVMGDHKLFSPTTVAVKMLGVVFAITGGLVIGREGPAIHMGAGIADICHNALNWMHSKWSGKPVEFDGHTKHNVIMMGSAAGFASAFRAPLGGMMYCTEEIATHWDIKAHMNVGCQSFVTVAIAAFVTNSIIRATADSGTIEFSSIVIFSEDESALNSGAVWAYEDIPGFLATAIVCGLIGGVTTKMSRVVNAWRADQKWLEPWYMRLADAGCVALATAFVLGIMPSFYTDCQPLSTERRLAGGNTNRRFVQYTCLDGEFSELASLTLSGEEGVIRHLMSRDQVEFGLAPLLIFVVFYVPLMSLVMGLKLPMGTFVPNLLLGSALGRICGEIAHGIADPSLNYELSVLSAPGVYALVGAAAMLGAWTRTMIAVVVTLVEISGDVGIVKPLIIAVVIARQISNSLDHHSYTHELFYSIVDKVSAKEGIKFLHPSDWKDPMSRLRRRTIDLGQNAADLGEEDADNSGSSKGKRPIVKLLSKRDFDGENTVPNMDDATPKRSNIIAEGDEGEEKL